MNKPSPIKIAVITLGVVVGISHIGLLGYVLRDNNPKIKNIPTINIPNGKYSSYTIKAGPEGYEIEYRADDPKVLESHRSLDLNKERRGWFGGSSEIRREHRTDQFTREGTRNLGGATGEEGKSAKEVECLLADAGSRSQGALAGSAIAAGVAVPAVASIPYVGWLAGGWALLLGQKAGSELGSQVGSVFNDC
tara:strand:+ start:536 stop:1114 length:579 start_codon:yes stop_codon:yes gene_type:complete